MRSDFHLTADKTTGFTLIELVVVILIITILAVTAAPKFIGVNNFDSFAYRDQMISSLRLIQQQSMQQTDSAFCHQMIIQTSGYGQSNNCAAPTLITDWQNQNTGFAIPSSSTVTINSTNTITFDSWGRAAECRASGCVIEFINDDTAQLCIEVEGYIHAC